MRIIPYSPDYREAWERFVLESNNGTLFHLQKFFDYHQPGKFDFNHLMFMENDRLVAVLPGLLDKDRIFESPMGASYGSIVTKDITYDYAMKLIDTLKEYGVKNAYKSFVLTSAPLIYDAHPNQDLDFALLWQGFYYETHYISSAIHLDPSRDYICRCQRSVRNYIRKTLRDSDMHFEINERYDEFYPILLSNLSRHNATPTHSYDDLIRLKELLPDNLKLFMVYYQGKPIGGSVMFFCNNQVALCFYNMFLYEYAACRPMHRIMYEVVKYSTEKGYRYVDIGVSQDTSADNPMTPNTSLIAFKESFDAKTIMRNTYRFDL